MFEIFAMFCLASADASCVSRILPSGGFETLANCEAILDETNLPEFANKLACQSRPKSSLEFDEISTGLYAHSGQVVAFVDGYRGDFSNMGFVIGETGVLAIDSGGSHETGTALYLAIRERTNLPIMGLVLTHMHPDHVFGARFFEDMGVPIFGHEKLARALADRADSYLTNYAADLGEEDMLLKALPQNIIGIEGQEEIDLGKRKLQLKAWSLAHSNNDLSVFDKESQTLFTGDLLFHTHIPAIDGSLRGWQSVIEELKMLDVTNLIAGHGPVPLEFPQGFEDQMRYFDVLDHEASQAIKEGERLSEAVEHVGASEAKHWDVFENYHKRNVTVVFDELEWE